MAQLYDFLVEAELQQYYTHLTTKLNVINVTDVKHAEDEELAGIGMTRPEIRRLKKFVKKHCQPKALNKLKRILTKSQEESRPSSFDENALSGRSPPNTTQQRRTSRLIEQSTVAVSCKLGAGEFGTVHYGVWKREENVKLQVAVKTLTKSVMKENAEKFLEEIAAMHRLDHAHVAKLYGVVIEQQVVMMVAELAPMKSLVDCLRDPGNRAYFSVAVLCNLAVQVADGMSYLESQTFVHRDLAARNILVFSKDMVKICDHGLTRALGVGLEYYQMNVNINLKLPIAWCAPESISNGNFTSASDVWSFGVTLWEMFSYGFQPWAGFTGSQIASAIGPDEGQRLDQPERCPKEFYDLMLLCWSHEPSRRPRFAKLVEGMPQMKATQHIVCRESTACRSDCLSYCVGDVITLLDKSCPISGFWKGIHEPSNKVGLFCTADTLPYVESKVSGVVLRKGKVSRKESDRKSLRPGQRLHAGMISVPQNDLRHMGHVGHDGVMFGDVSCLDQKQERWLSKGDDICGSSISLPVSVHSSTITKSCSNSSLVSDVTSVVTSIISSDTLTDVSSMHEDCESLPDEEDVLDDSFQYDSPNEDLDDFKIPDISNSFDLGPSLMDEVMKAFGGGSKEERSSLSRMKTKPEDLLSREEASKHSLETSHAVSVSKVTDGNRRTRSVRGQASPASERRPSSYQNGQTASSSVPHRNDAVDRQENTQHKELEEKTRAMAITSDRVDNLTEVLDQKSKPAAVASMGESLMRPPHHLQQAVATAGRAHQLRREPDAAAAAVAASSLSDSRGSLKNGMLSKIGSALTRKNSNLEHKMLQSLDLRSSPPASISSSSEFLPGVRKLSSTSSSSLPVRNGAYPSLISHMSSTGLAMNEEEAGMSAVQRLRPGRSFTKTKEKIRSSVVSVIRNRGSSQKNARPPPQPNLNANLLFFDRLREQEMERAQLDEEKTSHDVNSADNQPSNGFSRNDLHPQPQQLKSRNGVSNSSQHHEGSIVEVEATVLAPSQILATSISSDIQPHPPSSGNNSPPASSEVVLRPKKKKEQGIGCIVTGESSFVTHRYPSVISRDSLRVSECSSLTRQSTSSNSTDDSGTTSLDGRVVQVSSSDSVWRANGFPKSLSKEPLQVQLWSTKMCDATSSPPRIEDIPSSFFDSERNDDDRSPTFRMFDGLRSNSEANERVLLLNSLANEAPHLEDSLYAWSDDVDGDVNSAIRLLKPRHHQGAVTNWEDKNPEPQKKRPIDDRDWDSSARLNYVMEQQPSSGRESPELVHV